MKVRERDMRRAYLL